MFGGMTPIEWYYKTRVRPRIFTASRVDPEIAHEWGLHKLRLAQNNRLLRFATTKILGYDHPMLETDFCGMRLRHPLGLAAGFDKYCEVYWGGIPACGWSFCEIGGITGPRQNGNPRPRMWRNEASQSLGNAMGFNNCGREDAFKTLLTYDSLVPKGFKIGLNVGKGKDTPLDKAPKEYADTIELLWPYIDFIVLNPSSPNTKDLRELQSKGMLTDLVQAAQFQNLCTAVLYNAQPKKLGIKLSPDETDKVYADVVDVCDENGVDFLVLTNTTIQRNVNEKWVPQDRGGISGWQLHDNSLRVQQNIYKEIKRRNGTVKIIGVGGISTGGDIYERILNGANIVEIFSAWPFEGPDLVKRCLKDLVLLLKSDGFKNVDEAVGRKLF